MIVWCAVCFENPQQPGSVRCKSCNGAVSLKSVKSTADIFARMREAWATEVEEDRRRTAAQREQMSRAQRERRARERAERAEPNVVVASWQSASDIRDDDLV